ncbi:MAG: hypothetical protein PWR06_2046 [Thermoanaerobacteraceae bacterium]|nr:hypothetical protein [Thermoanaerobacteraceae bacterium]
MRLKRFCFITPIVVIITILIVSSPMLNKEIESALPPHWIEMTLSEIESYRADDGGYTDMGEYIPDLERTYHAIQLLKTYAPNTTFPSPKTYLTSLLNRQAPKEEDLLINLETMYFAIATMSELGEVPDIHPSWDIYHMALRLQEYRLVSNEDKSNFYFKNDQNEMTVGDWIRKAAMVVEIGNIIDSDVPMLLGKQLHELWRDEILYSNQNYHLTIIHSLIKTLKLMGVDIKEMPHSSDLNKWLLERINQLSTEEFHSPLSLIDIWAGIESVELLGSAVKIPIEVREYIYSIELNGGGFDFVINEGTLDPYHTIMAIKIIEASGGIYMKTNHVIDQILNIQLSNGTFPTKTIRSSDLTLTYMALMSYNILKTSPPNSMALKKYLRSTLQDIIAQPKPDPYLLWIILEAMKILNDDIPKIIVSIDWYEWNINSSSDLQRLVSLLRMEQILDEKNIAQRQLVVQRIKSLQTADGSYSIGDGEDMKTTFLSVEILWRLNELSAEEIEGVTSWLMSLLIDEREDELSLENIYYIVSTLHLLGIQPPSTVQELIHGRLNQDGSFGNRNIQQIFMELIVFDLSRLKIN